MTVQIDYFDDVLISMVMKYSRGADISTSSC